MKKHWEVLGERLVNMIRPFVFANCHFLKLVPLLPSLCGITFQGDGPQVHEKDIPCIAKTGKGWEKIYTSKEQKK